jgi:hypothetical protein
MLTLYCGVSIDARAQRQTLADTVFFLANKKGLLGKIGRSLSVNNPDPILPADGPEKNEAAFIQYRGKLIRYIFIQKIGFDKSVNDTGKDNTRYFQWYRRSPSHHYREARDPE